MSNIEYNRAATLVSWKSGNHFCIKMNWNPIVSQDTKAAIRETLQQSYYASKLPDQVEIRPCHLCETLFKQLLKACDSFCSPSRLLAFVLALWGLCPGIVLVRLSCLSGLPALLSPPGLSLVPFSLSPPPIFSSGYECNSDTAFRIWYHSRIFSWHISSCFCTCDPGIRSYCFQAFFAYMPFPKSWRL